MKFTPFKLNLYVFFKIPSAYFSGVRVKTITKKEIIVGVRHRWINQNPFKSMYWATQGMASELATGLVMMQQIALSGEKISMLVVRQEGVFTKKAKGKIIFSCAVTEELKQAVQRSIQSKEGQTLRLISKGIDENGDVVSSFEYEWSIKVKA